MRRIAMYLLSVCAVIINIYLMLYWEPQNRVINKEDVSKEVLSYSKPVYKLELGEVLEQLSSDDRKDFEKIIKKLSAFDIGKIKEYYENSNEEEGVKNIFLILKKRLTKEDYKKMEKASYSFLDLERLKAQ